MRESSPIQFAKNSPVSGLQTEAKSLFRKILAISPDGSRFCPDRPISTNANSNEMRILGQYSKKNVGVEGASDSPKHDHDCPFGSAPVKSEFSLARSTAAS
jgi:hypothetical protein